MLKILFPVVVLVAVLLVPANASNESSVKRIKVIKGNDDQVDMVYYFHSLLEEALSYSDEAMGPVVLENVNFEHGQNRTFRLLNVPGELDVTYSMTSPEREVAYIPIKVPLLDGLLGKRQLLVKKSNAEAFEDVTEEELKLMVGCQGDNWPDSDILESNGYALYRAEHFESLFHMLERGRCDYFPRGINEILYDYQKFNGRYGELHMVDNVMLRYHAPVYFFVGRHNEALAKRIEFGLKIMEEQGVIKQRLAQTSAFEFDRNFEQSEYIKVFDLTSDN